MLTAEIAREVWRYDPDTGHFFWTCSPRYRISIGDRAGCFNGKYWILRYRGKSYKAARLAWLVTHGKWPDNQIDHINGDRLDDRICNLRAATNRENCRNRGVKSNNLLGVKGVSKNRYSYSSVISADGKNHYLGTFTTIKAAKAAYDSAALRLHGKFARIT